MCHSDCPKWQMREMVKPMSKTTWAFDKLSHLKRWNRAVCSTKKNKKWPADRDNSVSDMCSMFPSTGTWWMWRSRGAICRSVRTDTRCTPSWSSFCSTRRDNGIGWGFHTNVETLWVRVYGKVFFFALMNQIVFLAFVTLLSWQLVVFELAGVVLYLHLLS